MSTSESLKYEIFGLGCNLLNVEKHFSEEDENYGICGGCGQEDCDCKFELSCDKENRKVFDRMFPKEIL